MKIKLTIKMEIPNPAQVKFGLDLLPCVNPYCYAVNLAGSVRNQWLVIVCSLEGEMS